MCKNKWIHVFSKALTQSEMQTASSRIWTQVNYSSSYDDNHCVKDPVHGVLVSCLNSVSFFKTSYSTNARELSLSYDLSIAVKKNWIHNSFRSFILVKCK